MPSLLEINRALKTDSVTERMREETRAAFMEHQRACCRCLLASSRFEDIICPNGKLDYEKARLLKVV